MIRNFFFFLLPKSDFIGRVSSKYVMLFDNFRREGQTTVPTVVWKVHKGRKNCPIKDPYFYKFCSVFIWNKTGSSSLKNQPFLLSFWYDTTST